MTETTDKLSKYLSINFLSTDSIGLWLQLHIFTNALLRAILNLSLYHQVFLVFCLLCFTQITRPGIDFFASTKEVTFPIVIVSRTAQKLLDVYSGGRHLWVSTRGTPGPRLRYTLYCVPFEFYYCILTRKSFSSLQNLLNICHHDSLDILQLRVNTAQVPPGPAVDVCLLCFLDVSVWNNECMIWVWSMNLFFLHIVKYTVLVECSKSQTVLPNSMKEYGLVTVGTLLPYWS